MDKPNPEEVEQLKSELKATRHELEQMKNQPVPVLNPQDAFIEKLFDKGGDIVAAWLESSAESEKYSMDKKVEFKKVELKTAFDLDKRDKTYKGIILVICILSLVVLAFFEKATSVAPVLGVIIGLVMDTSSISDFFKGVKKKNGEEES